MCCIKKKAMTDRLHEDAQSCSCQNYIHFHVSAEKWHLTVFLEIICIQASKYYIVCMLYMKAYVDRIVAES